ncbi:MAG: PstS family phosphate ABC transporter substrate-binding protein [Methanomethylovorans sp.]|nr:PstS family phosphate ABC transporter substrate-binding protein [Methanomethylovorans sp.]
MIREMTKKLFNDEAGVSPIVATLVLIVVAIAGAAAVGMIMGTFSSNVSDNANTGDTKSAASSEIIVAGSTTVQPVSEILAKAYMKKNPGVKITVQGGGSGAGIASAATGIVDIGAASKYLTNDDKAKYPELNEHVIGGSAVVVIGKNLPATTVTKQELQMMYNATPGDQVTIGGENVDGTLAVWQRTEASGTEETFAEFLGFGKNVDKAVDDGNTQQRNAIGNDGVLKAIKESTGPAIGFVDYGFAKEAGSAITILKVDIDGTTTGYTPVDVTDSNVKTAIKARLAGTEQTTDASTTYPVELCRPLNYLTNGEPSSLVNNFIQFAMSPGSIEYFHQAGYYGISELL